MNANRVHRWRRAAAERVRTSRGKAEIVEFVPMAIAIAPVVAVPEDVRIELRTGALCGQRRLASAVTR